MRRADEGGIAINCSQTVLGVEEAFQLAASNAGIAATSSCRLNEPKVLYLSKALQLRFAVINLP